MKKRYLLLIAVGLFAGLGGVRFASSRAEASDAQPPPGVWRDRVVSPFKIVELLPPQGSTFAIRRIPKPPGDFKIFEADPSLDRSRR